MEHSTDRARRTSEKRLEEVFAELLTLHPPESITVTSLCKAADVNRSTFYSNYEDIFDLSERMQMRIEDEIVSFFVPNPETGEYELDYMRMLETVKSRPAEFRAYFRLGKFTHHTQEKLVERLTSGKFFDGSEYSVLFFRSGVAAVIGKWISNGCAEEPAVIADVCKRFAAGLTRGSG